MEFLESKCTHNWGRGEKERKEKGETEAFLARGNKKTRSHAAVTRSFSSDISASTFP